MTQFTVSEKTIERIETIIGRRFFRGGDKAINEALTKLGVPEIKDY